MAKNTGRGTRAGRSDSNFLRAKSIGGSFRAPPRRWLTPITPTPPTTAPREDMR